MKKRILLLAALLSVMPLAHSNCRVSGQTNPSTQPILPWPLANEILARVRPPNFPDKNFPVTDYGAVGDGKTDNTEAFRAAINTCVAAGGGHVVVPKGTFVTGAILLHSNVDLHLAGATILFSGDVKKYPQMITRYQGIDLMNCSPAIHAVDQTNIAITGDGTLDGSLMTWNHDTRTPSSWLALQKMAHDGVPIAERKFGSPGNSIRTTLVEPYHCTNVLIQGITIRKSHFWQTHPCLCTNVTVDGITTTSTSSQTDGCDPESCRDVVIENCTLGAGDDDIAIKAGRNPDSQRVHEPCENLVIMHSRFHGPWGLVTCGSEQTEGIQHVFVYDCSTIESAPDAHHQTGCAIALYLKTSPERGGFIRDIHLDKVSGKFYRAILEGTMNYDKESSMNVGHPLPEVGDITLSHVSDAGGGLPIVLDLAGLAGDPITSVSLSDCDFTQVAKRNFLNNIEPVKYENVTINGKPAQ
jgi:polygalacturonase